MVQGIEKWVEIFEIDDIYCLAVCLAYKHNTQPFKIEILGNKWLIKHDTIEGYLCGEFDGDLTAFQYLQEKFKDHKHLSDFMKSLTWTS